MTQPGALLDYRRARVTIYGSFFGHVLRWLVNGIPLNEGIETALIDL